MEQLKPCSFLKKIFFKKPLRKEYAPCIYHYWRKPSGCVLRISLATSQVNSATLSWCHFKQIIQTLKLDHFLFKMRIIVLSSKTSLLIGVNNLYEITLLYIYIYIYRYTKASNSLGNHEISFVTENKNSL